MINRIDQKIHCEIMTYVIVILRRNGNDLTNDLKIGSRLIIKVKLCRAQLILIC